MKSKVTALFILLSSFFVSNAQNSPLPAKEVLNNSLTQARASNKHVLIIFHASWCIWCHKMDSSINDPACRKFFTDNYIIEHLVVDESDNKKNLENPGASDFRDAQGGKDQGIPFWIILDKNGVVLNTSMMPAKDPAKPGDNTGCPASQNEVEYFISMLKKSSSMTAGQLDIIAKRFRQNQ